MEIRRRHIITALLVLGLLAIIIWPEILSTFFVMIFMGVVPGTELTIPAWVSMIGFLIALLFAIRWLMDTPAYRPVMTSHDRSRRHAARRRIIKQSTARQHAATTRSRKHAVKV